MVAFIQVAHAGLAGKERLEAFPLQVIQQGNGRYIRVPVTAGFMFVFSDDAGDIEHQFIAG